MSSSDGEANHQIFHDDVDAFLLRCVPIMHHYIRHRFLYYVLL